MLATIQKLAADGMSMVIVTHEIAFARDVADRLVFMRDGYVVEQSRARETIDRPREEATYLAKLAAGDTALRNRVV